MGRFGMVWAVGLAQLGLFTLLCLLLLGNDRGVFGLGTLPTLLVLAWALGLISLAVIVAHQRAGRDREVKASRRAADREATLRTAEAAAYELAQPLTVVATYAQLLQRSSRVFPELKPTIDQLANSCHQMTAILRNMEETVRHSRAQAAGLTILDEPEPLLEEQAGLEQEEEWERQETTSRAKRRMRLSSRLNP